MVQVRGAICRTIQAMNLEKGKNETNKRKTLNCKKDAAILNEKCLFF